MTEFALTTQEIHKGIEQGWHFGGQICVVLKDEVLLETAIGTDGTGKPMDIDRVMLWLSAGKPVTAVAVLQLWEKGQLSLDDPVAFHIPEFAANGKNNITIWNLLTHTGGFRFFDEAWYRQGWDEVIQRICSIRPEPRWIPGRQAGYHPASSWFILGEIIQRITGRPLREFVWEKILEPAGMLNTWMGIPDDEQSGVLEKLAPLWNTAVKPPELSYYETVAPLEAILPGSGLRGPVRDLAAFYRQLLWHTSLLSPQASVAMSTRHRTAMSDRTFQSVIDWGLGVILNSYHYNGSYPYCFGAYASPRTFGHGGAQCAMAFADPEFDLVVSWVVNGTPGEPGHQARQERINSAIYRDLGLSWHQNME